MSKALHALLIATCFLLAASTHAGAQIIEQEALHVLSLRVVANNQEVMAPVLQMAAGSPASVAIMSSEGPSYTLVVNVRPNTAKDGPNAGGVHVSLWNGDAGTGIRMIEGRMSASGTRAVSDEEGTVVELVSHAVYRDTP